MQKITISPILQVDMLIGLEGRFPSELWYGIFPLSLPFIFWPGLVRMGRIRQLDSKNQSPVKQRQSSIKTCGVPIEEKIFKSLLQEAKLSNIKEHHPMLRLAKDVTTLFIWFGFTGQAGLEAAFQVPVPRDSGLSPKAGSISNYCLTQENFTPNPGNCCPSISLKQCFGQ